MKGKRFLLIRLIHSLHNSRMGIARNDSLYIMYVCVALIYHVCVCGAYISCMCVWRLYIMYVCVALIYHVCVCGAYMFCLSLSQSGLFLILDLIFGFVTRVTRWVH
jgi:hypothetical protein